jgi:hypothetical protein
MYILQIHFGPSLKCLAVLLQLTATSLDFVEEEVRHLKEKAFKILVMCHLVTPGYFYNKGNNTL